jgi:hypothetical protein
MTFKDITESELHNIAIYMNGLWWFADDADNPFGVAVLVVPNGDRGAYLYTLAEAWRQMKLKKKEPSQLEAIPSSNSVLNKFGWGIRRNGKLMSVSLPVRLYNNEVRAELKAQAEQREVDFSNSIKVLPELIGLSKGKGR